MPTFPDKVPICVIFAGRPTPGDRAWGVCEEEIAAMTKRLKEAEKNLGNVEFVVGRAFTPEEASVLLKKAGDDAPVLAVNLKGTLYCCQAVGRFMVERKRGKILNVASISPNSMRKPRIFTW